MSVDIKSRRDYVFEKQLGVGGFGVVSRIRRKRDGAVFAEKTIKISSIKKLQSALGEAKLALSLKPHPNIVRVFTSFTDEDNNFVIIMEYCGQGDLAKDIQRRIQDSEHYQEKRIRSWLGMMAHALLFLHDNEIIHRDIKPQNVFICNDGELVKIGDFGLSKALDGCTSATSSVGTYSYLAPEICREESYNAKVDIWMLGVVLYEMVSFSLPFTAEGKNELQILKQVVEKIKNSAYPSIDDGTYNKSLYTLIGKMLTKDHKKRPSISDVLNDPFLIAVQHQSMAERPQLSSSTDQADQEDEQGDEFYEQFSNNRHARPAASDAPRPKKRTDKEPEIGIENDNRLRGKAKVIRKAK